MEQSLQAKRVFFSILAGLLLSGLRLIFQPELPALHAAAEAGSVNEIKWRLRLGADVNQPGPYGRVPLWYARNFEVTKLLVDHGADMNHADPEADPGQVPALAMARDAKSLLYMVDHGGDINLEEGTPLETAVRWEDIDLVKKLIARGAKVNFSGRSPALFAAAERGQSQMFEYLLSQGAAVGGKDGYGKTLLHAAAGFEGDNTKIIKLLLDRGLDVNVTTLYGDTPLHDAAYGHGFNARFLLNHGANPNLGNHDGERPEDIANRLKTGAVAAFK